ncbi:hypothetical protein NPIL_533611 [Nephila pilipes]|uniref:Uncharacterized protein n=1 Tax=Nephila pilipes TaxID=299642 RepID=A0A8X6T5W8_NEPPI|nr:hypothetical protein NPIL_533611 [Nephila pilipes]
MLRRAPRLATNAVQQRRRLITTRMHKPRSQPHALPLRYARAPSQMPDLNALSARVKTDLKMLLHDELEETTSFDRKPGANSDNGDFISLVESLPEDVLTAWERNRNQEMADTKNSRYLNI